MLFYMYRDAFGGAMLFAGGYQNGGTYYRQKAGNTNTGIHRQVVSHAVSSEKCAAAPLLKADVRIQRFQKPL